MNYEIDLPPPSGVTNSSCNITGIKSMKSFNLNDDDSIKQFLITTADTKSKLYQLKLDLPIMILAKTKDGKFIKENEMSDEFKEECYNQLKDKCEANEDYETCHKLQKQIKALKTK
jgi:hypothetical protein